MAAQPDHFLTPDQLRPGIFVMLDLSWIQQSFALNSFKIRNEEQVRELRALNLPRYRYDPLRSDAPVELTPAPTAVDPDPAPVPEADPAVLAQQQRLAVVAKWRDRVGHAERAFEQATV